MRLSGRRKTPIPPRFTSLALLNREAGRRIRLTLLALALAASSGCTSLAEWWRNGCKVGPNYCPPPAPVAEQWIDAADPHLGTQPAELSDWWRVFDDPVLDRLVAMAREQNLSLKIAACRIWEARALRAVVAGSFWPQSQQMVGSFKRSRFSDNMYPFGRFPFNREHDDWMFGFDAAWELDLWGKIRRAVESAEANFEAQVANYDDVAVTLQGDVAAAYLEMRTLEERLQYARQNAQLQRESLRIAEQRFKAGIVSELDVHQARAQLAITESMIPKLEQGHRQIANALCLLLGLPPGSLEAELSPPAPVPVPPPEVVVGVPAELLERRPDVRRAERMAAAQCARIGVAEAEFYPHIALTGTIGIEAEQFSDLFEWPSMMGKIGPGFQWNILHYGRILNTVRAEDARFRQAVLAYQQTVLAAAKEVEDAIVAFLQEQRRVRHLQQAAADAQRALELALHLYREGVIDYQRVLDSERALLGQQDALAESRGAVATNLVKIYKALGGGWQVRLQPEQTAPAESPALPELPPGSAQPQAAPGAAPELAPSGPLPPRDVPDEPAEPLPPSPAHAPREEPRAVPEPTMK